MNHVCHCSVGFSRNRLLNQVLYGVLLTMRWSFLSFPRIVSLRNEIRDCFQSVSNLYFWHRLGVLGSEWEQEGANVLQLSGFSGANHKLKLQKQIRLQGLNLPSVPLLAVSVTNKKQCSFISTVSNDVHVTLFGFYLLLFKFKCKKWNER